MKIAILTSNHQEVARIPVKLLDLVFCTLNNPHAEDLLKVTDSTGQVYWCDEIEFVDENNLTTYNDYLRHMIAQEQEAFDKADDERVKDAIGRRLAVFRKELKNQQQ